VVRVSRLQEQRARTRKQVQGARPSSITKCLGNGGSRVDDQVGRARDGAPDRAGENKRRAGQGEIRAAGSAPITEVEHIRKGDRAAAAVLNRTAADRQRPGAEGARGIGAAQDDGSLRSVSAHVEYGAA